MIIIPTVTKAIKSPNNFFFTTFESMIIEGRDSAVTDIINDRAVPRPTPFATNASAIGKVPNISAYIGIPTIVAIKTEYHLSLPKIEFIIFSGM